MSDHTAKPDYAHVWMAYIRRQLAGDHDTPLPEPVQLFDDNDQALEAAKARHPARPIENIDSDAL